MWAQTASVEGTVTDLATGKPLSGVNLLLATGDLTTTTVTGVYGAMSDRAGHFSIQGVKPGMYALVGNKAGYLPAPPNPAIPVPILTLKAGQQVTGYKVAMAPRSVISGRVVDDLGDPVQGTMVVLQNASDIPHTGPTFGWTTGTTDDHGEFRILTLPGRFRVMAGASYYGNSALEVRADGSVAGPLMATYFPGVLNRDAAEIVEIGPGDVRQGLEIRLQRQSRTQTSGSTSLSGVVTGIPPGVRPMVTLRFGNTPEQANSGMMAGVGPDGKFTFNGIPSGMAYRVYAMASGNTMLQSETLEGRLDGSNSNLQLTLAPVSETVGSVEFADGSHPSNLKVRLSSPMAAVFSANPAANGFPVDATGSFRIPPQLASVYSVTVEPLPENAYIRAINVDGTETSDKTMDLTHSKGGRVKITVALDGAQISGRVLDADGDPSMNPMLRVVLGTDANHLSKNSLIVADGKYSFKGIAPGKYRILALDGISFAAESTRMGDFVKTLYERAVEVEIKPGDRIVKDLKVVTKESLHE